MVHNHPPRRYRLTLTKFAAVLAFAVLAAALAQAQTFKLLHSFSNGGDGGSPTAGITFDAAGNIYGTASTGGDNNAGTVFEMKRNGDGWTLNTLHTFEPNQGDGSTPLGGVSFGPGGAMFGTTANGGTGCLGGCGAVYSVRAPQTFCHTGVCPWVEGVAWGFHGYPSDGIQPWYENLVFDSLGNIYGTTCGGGPVNYGIVFELTPSGNGWAEEILHRFTGADGSCPQSGVVFDSAGNLYGTTASGGTDNEGVLYELSPSGSGRWTQTILHNFTLQQNEEAPVGSVTPDIYGNFYGMTVSGEVYELTPSGNSWDFTAIYHLAKAGGYGALAIDAAGNLYGQQFEGGQYGVGAVFKLSPNNGNWTYTDLHDFTIVNGGAFPDGWVTLDAQGNLYGTTSQGGMHSQGCGFWGCGSVWEITFQ
jgi:uncharacterized repeat protein (TIGR03803 family)